MHCLLETCFLLTTQILRRGLKNIWSSVWLCARNWFVKSALNSLSMHRASVSFFSSRSRNNTNFSTFNLKLNFWSFLIRKVKQPQMLYMFLLQAQRNCGLSGFLWMLVSYYPLKDPNMLSKECWVIEVCGLASGRFRMGLWWSVSQRSQNYMVQPGARNLELCLRIERKRGVEIMKYHQEWIKRPWTQMKT